jgi:hypothetical protein
MPVMLSLSKHDVKARSRNIMLRQAQHDIYLFWKDLKKNHPIFLIMPLYLQALAIALIFLPHYFFQE